MSSNSILIVVAIVVLLFLLYRSKESYIMENPLTLNKYPFNPLSTQSVFNEPANQFQLQTTPQGTDRGAYKALQIVDDRYQAYLKNPINYTVNSGFNATGNLWTDMSLANQVSGVQGSAWNTL